MSIETKTVRQRLAIRQHLDGKLPVADVAAIMSGDATTLAEWSRPLTADERHQRNELIFDLWLAGGTTRQIASECTIDHTTVMRILHMVQDARLEVTHQIEKPPIYNVWNVPQCDPRFGLDYPGRIPGRIVQNVLYLYTKPFDLVVDPMAGGGVTVDVCKAMGRRYRCYDIKPAREDVHQWDIRRGFPRLPQKPSLILLDPPYWRLMQDSYSADGVASYTYPKWLNFIEKLARDCWNTIKPGGVVAYIAEAFLDEKELGRFVDTTFDSIGFFLHCGFVQEQRISIPIPSQIKSMHDVLYAKDKGILLDLNRDLVIFRKPCHKKR